MVREKREKKTHGEGKKLQLPLRPGFGCTGRRCSLRSNHIHTTFPRSDMTMHHVTISENAGILTPVTSMEVKRGVMKRLLVSYLPDVIAVFDGQESLYTNWPLTQTYSEILEFTVTIDEEDELSGQRSKTSFEVVIQHRCFIFSLVLCHYLSGNSEYKPEEFFKVQAAVRTVQAILLEQFANRCYHVGRCFYSPLGERWPLGEALGALECRRGFRQSMRLSHMGLSLNLDSSYATFLRPQKVNEFVKNFLPSFDFATPLSDTDRLKIEGALTGVAVKVVGKNTKNNRMYRISGLTSQNDLITPESLGAKFCKFHEFDIRQIPESQLPCLQVESQQIPNYHEHQTSVQVVALPMEVFEIVEGQSYSPILNEGQLQDFLKVSRLGPHDREAAIKKILSDNDYENDDNAKGFDLEVGNQLAFINARILPAPLLKYHETCDEPIYLPKNGQWTMQNKKMVQGGAVSHWIIINFTEDVKPDDAKGFYIELAKTCVSYGMTFTTEPAIQLCNSKPDQVESILKEQYGAAMKKIAPKELDLLIVILPDNNGPLYGNLKRICETQIGLVSQCCLAKHVLQKKQQYLSNLSLKINVKVGGWNTVFADTISNPLRLRTMILGADVTHPPGGDSSPSIAAVVGSVDPELTKYECLVRAQAPRLEYIKDLYNEDGPDHGMIVELIRSFKKIAQGLPERIIFYRDGVGESQFHKVLEWELDAIYKACKFIEPNYKPFVTLVVVQKRHHTRLFANDCNASDRNGNILPGTVVDRIVSHRTEFDFFLCSHAGTKGCTSRPTHYHVLWDDNNFTADQLQNLTYSLCYMQVRCTRSVSIVPAVYYADLAAYRARCYVKPKALHSAITSGTVSGSIGMGGGLEIDVEVEPLLALNERVKSVMFYC